MKLFLHFINIAVVNSFIIHKEMAEAKNQKPLNQKNFRLVLCEQLAEVGKEQTSTSREAAVGAATKPPRRGGSVFIATFVPCTSVRLVMCLCALFLTGCVSHSGIKPRTIRHADFFLYIIVNGSCFWTSLFFFCLLKSDTSSTS